MKLLLYKLRFQLARFQFYLQRMYWTHKYVGRKVTINPKYINDWVFSHDNYNAHCEFYDFFGDDGSYDNEVLLGMYMLMGENVYGEVKGVGFNTLQCYFYANGMSHSAYYDLKDLVLLD